MIKTLGLVVLLVSTFATTASALDGFTGHWTGLGTYQTQEMLRATDAEFDLTIAQTNTQLSIKDCWTFIDSSVGKRTSCYQSDYTVDDNAQIFANGQKIGDIFPGRISAYQSNSQVSELMNFDLDGNRELLLRYNYSNMNGNITVRFAKLSPVK